MTIVLRTSTKSFFRSRTAVCTMILLSIMCLTATLLGTLLIDAQGWWLTLVLISLTVPLVGVLLSVWAFRVLFHDEQYGAGIFKYDSGRGSRESA